MPATAPANGDTPAFAGVTGLGRVTEFIIPAKTGPLSAKTGPLPRHPSESWDLMVSAASPAKGDTPAFAGVTDLGAGFGSGLGDGPVSGYGLRPKTNLGQRTNSGQRTNWPDDELGPGGGPGSEDGEGWCGGPRGTAWW